MEAPTSGDVLFFWRRAAASDAGPQAEPSQYRVVFWRPGFWRVHPPGPRQLRFVFWWALHWLHVFGNRDYGVVVVYDGDVVAHRSCIFPRYFRFPFMAAGDLQIGDTWTAEDCKGRGLGTLGLSKAVELTSKPGRVFWYLTERSNVASIRVAEKAGFGLRAKGARIARFGSRMLGAFVIATEIQNGREPAGGWMYPHVKRALDIYLILLALPIAAPVFLLSALAIRIIDGKPVLYRGTRAGLHGRPFVMYKFRTMVADAERRGGTSTGADDERITRVGQLLRRWKLDELPQLLNVLKGDMSLVGPRPQVLDEVAGYTEEEGAILSVKPGITDYASIRFRNEGEILRGHPDPDEAYQRLIRPEKMRLGLLYARERSLRVDLRIVLTTVLAILGRPASRREAAGRRREAEAIEGSDEPQPAQSHAITPAAPASGKTR